MVKTANITDRNGAIDMVDYYCDVTDHLSMLKKILGMEATREKILPIVSKLFLTRTLRLLSAMIFTRLLSCQNAGLWSVPLLGLTNAGDFGKTANVNYRTHSKCSLLHSFAFS